MEDAVSKLKEGVSLEEIKTELKDQGLNSGNVFTVIASVKKELNKQYGEQIQKAILEKDEDELVNQLPLEKSMIDELLGTQKSEYKANISRGVRKLVKSGVPADEIRKQFDTSLLTEEEFQAAVLSAQIKTAAEKEEKNNGVMAIFGGLGLIALGIIITIATSTGDSTRVFYGLMVVGAIMFFRGLAASFS